ncbi:MAG: chemotaxis protein CheA [Thermoanaerobacteraceae bacterium]|nr:chemotaxis protein CheA [Thermoanaerobacteraceae bacterium]
MSSFDMSQYLNVFLDEAEEQLEIMDEGFIKLEQNGDDADLLNKVFRAAHTLKGASASMGFTNMAGLTHEMENVLDKLRQGEIGVSQHLVDVLLECLDALGQMKQEIISSGQDQGIQTDDLVTKLKQAITQEEGSGAIPESKSDGRLERERKAGFALSDLTEVEKNLINSAEIKGYYVYRIKVELSPGCQMKSVRAYLVFNNLEDVGEIIKTIPSTEDIEDEKFDNSFEIFLVTNEDQNKVSNIIMSISEIEAVSIIPVSLSNRDTDRASSELHNEQRQKTETQAGQQAQQKQGKAAPKIQVQPKKVSQTIRVDVERLENLMNLVGELVIDRTRLTDVGETIKGKLGADDVVESLEEITVHVGRITSELQEEILKARMLPIEQVFKRFPRMVRDLAKKANKEIDFIVEGQETELDRTVIEEISDPLIHLLRNSIDHGIEPPDERRQIGKPEKGTVKLNAFHEENQIVITVSDDGRGIDPAKIRQKALEKGLITAEAASRMSEQECINLIFTPGFSTASQVSDVSGRGVGMDIVRAHIEKINGIIDIDSEVGRGTTFTIKLPLTLAISRSLLLRVRENVLAIPLVNVVEIIDVESDKIYSMQNQEVTVIRGNVLPLFKLDAVLGWPPREEKTERTKLPVVVAGISDKRVGFIVDTLIGEQEIVIKPLGDYLGQIPGLAGATILGDGRVALILDVRGLVEHTGVRSGYEQAN